MNKVQLIAFPPPDKCHRYKRAEEKDLETYPQLAYTIKSGCCKDDTPVDEPLWLAESEGLLD